MSAKSGHFRKKMFSSAPDFALGFVEIEVFKVVDA
jgi:hypothetical protein